MADEMLNALVTEAMFRALDEKKREELIKSALAALVKPSTGGYGHRSTTPIEDAFERAIREVAYDVVRELCKTKEALRAIEAVATEAFKKMLTDKDRLATSMADAIVVALGKAY